MYGSRTLAPKDKNITVREMSQYTCTDYTETGSMLQAFLSIIQHYLIFSSLLQHTDRTFHGIDGSVQRSDSHVLVNTFDYLELQPIADAAPVFKEAKVLDVSECEGLYCSEPWYIPVRNRLKLVQDVEFIMYQ